MKLRYYALALIAIMITGICCSLFLFPVPDVSAVIAELNDRIQSGQTIDSSAFSEMKQQWQAYRVHLQVCLIVLLCLVAATAGVFLYLLHRKVLRPFWQMRDFAQRVAAGDLDLPLSMDKQNAFGAFTESFDLMRSELQRAKQSERAAEQSKRELVASLSHDIQTPVSSIKAVAELMEITMDEPYRERMQIILQKAGQIQTLVADLFHATLEELHSLRVTPAPFPSDRIAGMIRQADYYGRARIGEIPECLVWADPIRLSQVIDNIMANSLKYADTDIDISAEADSDGLALVFRDFGPGAAQEELPLLFSKYYRGKLAEGKSGYGLGLYISRTLTERMGGRLECANADPGFAVRLWLQYDGGGVT
ncbi:MAG: HAMP domain-containing histidine kinase [Oscillospiraceae bacterium]|nr:HAMP domain-containing histidine kinase [Oscillospiraceae bacterium]